MVSNMDSIFEKLSKERKALQQTGQLPDWFTTQGWQAFKEKYLYEAEGYADTVSRITHTLAKHTDDPEEWEKRFYEIIYKGWLALSTPVLSNTGTPKGCPVSCSGGYIEDSIFGFYNGQLEAAMLTKNGFGTSAYLGDIRARGAKISSGGKASGVVPVFKDFVQVMRDVSQGTSRRGAWAGYLPIDHDDFWELTDQVKNHPDDANIGYNYSNDFIDRLQAGDKDAIARYQRHMKLRALTGKGYFFFPDKVNALSPQMYKDFNLEVLASNLCTEITLFSDQEHTYTCVLSSMNLAKYDEWKDTDAVFVATVFLDCVAEEFIQLGENINGLEKAVKATKKGRALGLGALGFHTYLQDNMIPFESFAAHMKNIEIFRRISEEAKRASQWMAENWGEPEWCTGYGVRNTHLLAIAPNTSSALICGGVSQGIEPIVANAYTQPSSAGELERINPSLIRLLKSKGKYTDRVIDDIMRKKGSVQHLDWLSQEEKDVYKTAYEIDQHAIIRLASTRQQYIDQAQSINLFFDEEAPEEYMSSVHKQAILDPNIKSLYYMRTAAGVNGSSGECVACEG